MKKNSSGIVWAALLGFVPLGTGCMATSADPGADSEPSASEPVAATQEALTTFGTWSFTSTSPVAISLTGPTATGDTCFLTGIYGALKGPNLGETGAAFVNVAPDPATNKQIVKINPGSGSGGLRVDGVCINVATNRTIHSLTFPDPGFGSTGWPIPNANNHCGISGVSAMAGFIGVTNGQTTGVSIAKSGPNWALSGILNMQQDGFSAGSVNVTCVDVSTTASGSASWGVGTGSGLVSTTIVASAGTTIPCYLTAIDGDFFDASLTHSSLDGAGAEFVSGGWTMHARDGKGSNVECLTLVP